MKKLRTSFNPIQQYTQVERLSDNWRHRPLAHLLCYSTQWFSQCLRHIRTSGMSSTNSFHGFFNYRDYIIDSLHRFKWNKYIFCAVLDAAKFINVIYMALCVLLRQFIIRQIARGPTTSLRRRLAVSIAESWSLFWSPLLFRWALHFPWLQWLRRVHRWL